MRKYLLALLLFPACSPKESRPADVLPPDKMEIVLWDMVNAAEFYNAFINRLDSSFNKDSAKDATYASVYRLHGIDKKQFERSYSWYQQHPDKMAVVLDSLSRKNAPPTWQDLATPVPDTARRRLLRKPIQEDLQVD